MTSGEAEQLRPFVRFVEARSKAWKDVHRDSAFYGQKYPGANLTVGDFITLANIIKKKLGETAGD